ncbi:hypothetical protein EON63_06590 [archaeon]|nr:MAG: hypothetical protein EON63_06590 [archaeon]
MVHITKSIEAEQTSINCQSFYIKMANINNFSLQAENGGKVEALYTQITRGVVREGDMVVDLVRGHLQVGYPYTFLSFTLIPYTVYHIPCTIHHTGEGP